MTTVKFESLGGLFVKIPVVVGDGFHASFLLDTGAGINLVSHRFLELITSQPSGSYTGRRTSGEEMTLPMVVLPSVAVGEMSVPEVRAGVTELFGHLPPELGRVDGAISWRFFEDRLFTIDFSNSLLIVDGPTGSGVPVPLRVERDQEKTKAFVEIAEAGWFDIDTGASLTVVDVSLAEKFGVNLTSPAVKRVESWNETGFPFSAFYTSIPKIRTAVGDVVQVHPKVVFRELIHDGVIGSDFFRGRRVTFDLARAEMGVE